MTNCHMKRWPKNWGVWGSIRSEWRCETELVLCFNRMNFKADVKSETHRQNREELLPGPKQPELPPCPSPRPRADDVTASFSLRDLPALARPACPALKKKKKKKHTHLSRRASFSAHRSGEHWFSLCANCKRKVAAARPHSVHSKHRREPEIERDDSNFQRRFFLNPSLTDIGPFHFYR